MLDLEEARPLITELVTGREDAADIIDKFVALDKPAPAPQDVQTALAENNAQWEARYNENDAKWRERYIKTWSNPDTVTEVLGGDTKPREFNKQMIDPAPKTYPSWQGLIEQMKGGKK